MIDTVLFKLLALALYLAASGGSDFALDLVDVSKGEVASMKVVRTADGFRIEGLGGEPMTVKQQGSRFDFHLPGEGRPLAIDLGKEAARLGKSADAVRLTLDGQEFQIAPSGSVRYLLAQGSSTLVVAHRPATTGSGGKWTGILRVHDVPQTMSVKAYLANEFTLEREGQPELALAPTDAVSADDLRAADGKQVGVEGELAAPTPPQEGEAYPMGPDGKPLERSARFQVRALRVIADGK